MINIQQDRVTNNNELGDEFYDSNIELEEQEDEDLIMTLGLLQE